MRKIWTRALWIACWTAGSLLAAPDVAGAQQEATWKQPPLLGRSIKELYLGLPPRTRVEYFRLDREPLPEGEEGVSGPCGLVRWIVGPDPEDPEGWRVEIEATFFESNTRVVHTERLRPEMRELVFREIRQQAGRTFYLTWNPDEGIKGLEMMGGVLRREEFDPVRGALFPLTAIERVRRGVAVPSAAPVFQPLSGATETLALSVEGDGRERVLELRRGDDLLAGSYRFEGSELVSFRWQDGGPTATRIPRRAYDGQLATRKERLATQEPPVPVRD